MHTPAEYRAEATLQEYYQEYRTIISSPRLELVADEIIGKRYYFEHLSPQIGSYRIHLRAVRKSNTSHPLGENNLPKTAADCHCLFLQLIRAENIHYDTETGEPIFGSPLAYLEIRINVNDNSKKFAKRHIDQIGQILRILLQPSLDNSSQKPTPAWWQPYQQLIAQDPVFNDLYERRQFPELAIELFKVQHQQELQKYPKEIQENARNHIGEILI